MKRTAVLTLLAVSVLVAVPAAAVAGWSKPQSIFSDPAGSPVLAGNDRGDRVLVFTGTDVALGGHGIYFAQARAGRRFGRPRLIPGTAAEHHPVQDPQVAISPAGDALIGWQYWDNTDPPDIPNRDDGCCLGARAVVVDARGRLGRVTTLGPPGRLHRLGPMDIDSAKRFAIVSTGYPTSSVRSASRARNFGAAARLEDSARFVLAVDARADSTLVIGHRNYEVLTGIYVDHDGRVGAQQVLSPPLPGQSGGSSAAVDKHGGAVVAWESYHPHEKLTVATRSAGQPFRIQQLAGGEQFAKLAVAPDGSAVVAWPSGAGDLVAARRRPGALFDAPATLVPAYDNSFMDVVPAIASGGHAAFIWSSSGSNGAPDVNTAILDPGGRVRARPDLGFAVSFRDWTTSIDARGRATAAWHDNAAVRASVGR